MPSKINLAVRLQHWMDSVPGQTFLNYAYSWGASIVIAGALFKLTHLPGGNLMLFLGMGTEIVVFFLSAFDRPFDKSEAGKELPADYETDEEIEAALEREERQQKGFSPADSPAAASTPLADTPSAAAAAAAPSVIAFAPTGAATSAPAGAAVAAPTPAAASSEVLPAAAAVGISIPRDADAEQLTAIIREANDELLHRAQAVLSPEMEAVTQSYIERLRSLTDTLSEVDAQSARLARDSEEMERLGRTLTSINSIYELQLKGASSQIVTIDQINEQTHLLVKQIEELNGVYSRMINALTVNARAAGGAAPTE